MTNIQTRLTGDAVEKTVRIEARPETIFPYFTDPDRIIRWKGIDAQLDPRPGGIYRVNVTGQAIARGEFLEVTPYTRIVFTWGFEGGGPLAPGASTVEVFFIRDGSGTIVRLRHYGLPADQRQSHTEGWAHFLERLAIAAIGRDAGPDPWIVSPSATQKSPSS